MTKHVAVLMGGFSAEREVSLVSGAAVSNALNDSGYQVTTIDVQRDVGALLTRLYPRPDVVFNALHGRFGEDGCLQGLLNILGIPYTHSGLLASALAMDKPTAKRVFAAAGIPVVEHQVLDIEEIAAGKTMKPPFVVKPVNEGSSVGVHIILEGSNFDPFAGNGWTYGKKVMVERYIPGRELTVTVMGDRALAVTEIIAQGSHNFYDYGAKYEHGGSRHVIPAQIDTKVYQAAMDIALRAHQALGCRGVSRSDLRYDGKDVYILEVNTQPGMTPTSLVPEQAAHVNISFAALVSWMVEHAECDA
jgi:D-alanine-D-alanine ligase